MRAWVRTRPAVVVLVGVLVVLGVAGVGYAASSKADFGLQVSPASQSVQQGRTAAFSVVATATGGFTGLVGYAVSGLPSGATATVTPATTAFPSLTGSTTTTLGVAVGRATPPGTYGLTITGTSGSTKRTVSAGLTVTRADAGPFTLSATPGSLSTGPGSTAVYTLTLTRSGSFAGDVRLGGPSGLPSGVVASFSSNTIPAGGTSATLQVASSPTTRDGAYAFTVVGSSDEGSQSVQAQLVIDSKLSSKPFSISGGAPTRSLAPGVADQPLDLAVTNPNNQPLLLTNLGVVVSGTSNAGCGASNFQVTQYSGPYPLTVPAGSTGRTLSSLGVAPGQMPQLRMVDLPATNQDACKGVTVALSYSASATGK